MITAIGFLIITFGGYVAALVRHPFWGLLVYANIYFNAPDSALNWWAIYLPDLRWSFITAAVMVASIIIHRKKISSHKFRTLNLVFIFYIFVEIEAFFFAVNPIEAARLAQTFQTYCITGFLLLKSLVTFDQMRLFILLIVGFVGSLSVKAYTEGERVNGRLENIGPGDAFSSNEFGVLLAAVIPMMLPYLLRGKVSEKLISLAALIFALNAFILCSSRGAFVSLAVGIIYGFSIVASKEIRKYILLASILIIPSAIYLADENFIDRVSSLWVSRTTSEQTLDELSTGRIDIWQYGIEMAKDYPFGAGPGGFRELSRSYMPEESLTVHPGADYGVRAAHNSYLEVLVEQGIVGLMIYLMILIYTLYLLAVSANRIRLLVIPGSFADLFIVSLNISFVVSVVGGMFGSQVYYEFFWWQVVVSLVAYSIINNSLSEKTVQIRELG